jgi:methylated-DNA-[protein]-cysteine S-methyltransferase
MGPAAPHPVPGPPKTYADIAKAVDNAPRAVGVACGRNPIPIIIPYHRVIAKGGRLGGFSGFAGLETKRRLLRLEGISVT